MTDDKRNGLFTTLKTLGRSILKGDITVLGVKFIVFFKDGSLYEWNSKNDNEGKKQ